MMAVVHTAKLLESNYETGWSHNARGIMRQDGVITLGV